MTAPNDLPDVFDPLRHADWTKITLGKSGAGVWRITMNDGCSAFLKSEKAHGLGDLSGEIARLNWLTSMGFKSPRVVDTVEANGSLWLLMTAVPGRDLTHMVDRPDELVQVLSQGLKRLHALDPSTCPFDHSLDARIELAGRRLEAGLVDETDFDPIHDGKSGADILAWLRENRPATGHLGVTHGDASLPNVAAENERFSGILDCGSLGVADIWQDLAIACRSIRFSCGEGYIAPFLAAYGVEWDAEKYRYYCALDEMF